MSFTDLVKSVQKISAFSCNGEGGNPAGVLISPELPACEEMQAVAAAIGFSETVFASPVERKENTVWKTRYFSPESEVPFCGHATIALGAALALKEGNGIFDLELSEANITVEGSRNGGVLAASLQSPPTWSKPVDANLFESALELFGFSARDLDPQLPPAFAHAGANHLILALRDRGLLAEMAYELDKGRELMNSFGLVTIMLVHSSDETNFAVRNAFASGGVIEDPATGAAAAAFSGYLRDINWNNFGDKGGEIQIIQGEDMGLKSEIKTSFSAEKGSSIRVTGSTHLM